MYGDQFWRTPSLSYYMLISSLCRYCTPWLMLATTVSRRLSDCRTISVCTFSLPRDQYLVYYLADLVLFYATPLLTATVLYALIARKLLSHARPVSYRGSRRPTAENETTFAAKRRDGTTTDDVIVTGDARSNVQVLQYIGSSSWLDQDQRCVSRRFRYGGIFTGHHILNIS